MTIQSVEQITAFGKENVEALVKSSTLAVKGFEELAKVYTTLASQSIETTTSAVKALSSVKNPAEFQSLYSSLAKEGFDSFVSESRKFQELATSIVTSSFAPLTARVQALSSLAKVA